MVFTDVYQSDKIRYETLFTTKNETELAIYRNFQTLDTISANNTRWTKD